MSEFAVKCERLRKAYGPVVAVADVSLSVRRGECFGLLGPNGAGKTTTIEILEGLLSADAGDIEVLGRRWSHHAGELRQRLGSGGSDRVLTLESRRDPRESSGTDG